MRPASAKCSLFAIELLEPRLFLSGGEALSTVLAPAGLSQSGPPTAQAQVTVEIEGQGSPYSCISPGRMVYNPGLHLTVLGTDGDDTITVSQTPTSVTLTTAQGESTYAGALRSATVHGFAGQDTIRLADSVTAGITVYCGDEGSTVFDTGRGGDTIYGGAGDDTIISFGGGASHRIFGGGGTDSFWVDPGADLADTTPAQVAGGDVHRIAQFFQPYTTDPASPNYVPMAIHGQNLADPAASYAYRSFASSPLFTDGPDYRDIQQGAVGDCFFLSALASMASAHPEIIRQVIAPLGDGTYVVQFLRNGSPSYVRVDADLPVSGSSLAYAKTGADGELWVPLMEKAYASFRGGDSSYSSLRSGLPETVFSQVAGVASTFPSGMSIDTAWSFLSYQLSAGRPVAACSKTSASGPIIANHTYTVMSVQIIDSIRCVTVYNPWGYDGGTGHDANTNDGLVTLTISDFVQQFAGVAAALV